ncbi:ABC transporter family substrate-binding protein [Streptomyces sp. NPDC059740]|uniref:ABC transporter family substrate-binding protein n=1 Tax=Streptomyces sp. NPDC059740 TaxID=3346926 RepID=UPI0036529B40
MKVSRSLALVATLAASSLVLTACGGSDDDGSKADKAPPKTEAIDINAKDPSTLKQGGTFNWAISQFSTQWNQLEIDGSDVATSEVMRALVPSFWHSTATGAQVPNKAFLLGADSKTVGGKQVVTWNLNPKAKWSDGTPITWEDVKAESDAMNGKNKAYKVATSVGFEQVESVKKGKDDYQAIMTFAKPFADWKGMFNAANNEPLMPKKYMADPKLFNTGYLNKMPVTANAFKLGSIDKSAQTITVVADPKWWGDKPKLDKIVFHAMDTAAMANAFANGEIDYFDVGVDASSYKTASKASGGEIREAGSPNNRIFTLNGDSPKLKDPRVRHALFMATDRATIAKSDLNGLGWKPQTLDNNLLVNNQKGYQDNSGELGKYNPKAAEKLLDQAGWKKSGDVRKKDGQELSLRFVVPSGTPVSTSEGSIVTQMWAKVGIKVKVQTVPINDFFDKYVTPGDFDVAPFSLFATPFPASGASNFYTTKGGNNDANAGSKKLDDLLAEAATDASNPTHQLELINKADAEAWQVAGYMPLYQRPNIAAIKKNIANMGAIGMADVVYEKIGYTK